MGFIRKLPEGLISKIAAGEVIERPFSVVKELVENSIDAKARKIEIDIEEGGRKKIVVLDDGIGMTPEDAVLSLERHATSKLSSDEDLYCIKTLGFRGEALPSIAGVSLMTLETIPEGRTTGEAGIKIEIEGGRLLQKGATSLPVGTRMTVRNLFFNTPARLKFMKSKETEFAHIVSWIEAMALSRPAIGFVLRHNGKTEIRSEADREPRMRARDILGPDIAEFLHPVSLDRSRMSLRGFVTDHRASSTSAKSIFFFVNGRIVRDRTLQHAVLSAYENLLMKHRYPWVILNLEVPPDFVDVNVHPAKSEVRFANGSVVHELVRTGIRAVLGATETASSPASGFVKGSEDMSEPTHEFNRSCGTDRTQPSLSVQALRQGGSHPDLNSCGRVPQESVTNPLAGDVRVIGQVHATYLVCETPDKLILIDQHAAHERIGFEKLRKQFEEGGIAKQQLLIPQNFDLRPSQCEILKKYLEDLGRVGLEVEFFGGHTFLLRSIPVLLEGTDFVSLIEEIIESLQSFEKLTPLEEKIHEVLEGMACHRQVRAGDRLGNGEIEFLLKEMKSTPSSGQCPHGRPSVLEVPFSEMEKWFKRRP